MICLRSTFAVEVRLVSSKKASIDSLEARSYLSINEPFIIRICVVYYRENTISYAK